MANGSVVANLSNPADDLSSSHLLSSSVPSLSSSMSSRHGSPLISKTYRQASELFLTRRIQEALSAIEPIITNGYLSDQINGNSSDVVPIASAPKSLRIRVWSLYLKILDDVVNLGPEEGKSLFGSQEWRGLVAKAREGGVWEEVVSNGYGGIEGDVDAEVVISLSALLLTHSQSQTLTQQHLENYLSGSAAPNLDIAGRLQSESLSDGGLHPPRRHQSPNGGTDTPRDLNARVKILELYTLHVLPRNEEWDYAREFINLSEVLDEDKREMFLQTLQALQDEKNRTSQVEADLKREQDAQLEREKQAAIARQVEEAAAENARAEREKSGTPTALHKRTSSEVDYGIEASNPNGTGPVLPKGRPTKGVVKSKLPQQSSTRLSPPPRSPRSAKASISAPITFYKRASVMLSSLQRLLISIAQTSTKNPMVLVRTLLMFVGLILALSRRDVRERVQRIVGVGWQKVAGTVGMGVKISYI